MAETANAPTTDNAPPVVPSSPAPDLSGLVSSSPSGPTPSAAFQTQAAMAPYQDTEQAAIKKAADLANAPAPVPVVGPHARLIGMIQGLALGADAFGKSIATHGREGGVEEVQQVQQQQQQQKIQAQQASQAQRNSQIQQQLMVADTNHKLAQNILLMATIPNELAESDLKVKADTQNVAITGADFAASHGGMTPDQFNQALSNPNPVAGAASGPSSFFTTNAQQQLGAATKILGANDPYVQKLQGVIADPKATPKDLWMATSQLQNQIGLNQKAAEAQEKKETAANNSTVGKLSTPESLATPGSQAAIQAKISDPNTDPTDLPRLRALIPMADAAQKNALQIDAKKKAAEQAVTQGDPDAAGKMLANRSLTLAELKSRQVTPQFIEKVVAAAQKYDPNFKPAESDAQAKIAGAPSNQQFFGNTDSLLIKGGTLDQLKAAYDALGNTQIPAWNTVKQLEEAAAGSGPLARLAAVTLGVADDYSKVMSQGGSDTSREQAFHIIKPVLSPDAQSQTLDAIRKQVTSQRNGRIGQNPYMRDMYPDPSTLQETPGVAGATKAASPKASDFPRPAGVTPQAVLMQAPGGQPHWIEPDKLAAARAIPGIKEIQ